jgi:hypothetical protein
MSPRRAEILITAWLSGDCQFDDFVILNCVQHHGLVVIVTVLCNWLLLNREFWQHWFNPDQVHYFLKPCMKVILSLYHPENLHRCFVKKNLNTTETYFNCYIFSLCCHSTKYCLWARFDSFDIDFIVQEGVLMDVRTPIRRSLLNNVGGLGTCLC